MLPQFGTNYRRGRWSGADTKHGCPRRHKRSIPPQMDKSPWKSTPPAPGRCGQGGIPRPHNCMASRWWLVANCHRSPIWNKRIGVALQEWRSCPLGIEGNPPYSPQVGNVGVLGLLSGGITWGGRLGCFNSWRQACLEGELVWRQAWLLCGRYLQWGWWIIHSRSSGAWRNSWFAIWPREVLRLKVILRPSEETAYQLGVVQWIRYGSWRHCKRMGITPGNNNQRWTGITLFLIRT